MPYKRKRIFWGNFNITWKNFCCRHQKNASHTIYRYGNCMITIFFQEKETYIFFITRLFYLVQIAAETSSKFFFNNFLKLYQNCIISIFPYTRCMKLYDKRFRCMEL